MSLIRIIPWWSPLHDERIGVLGLFAGKVEEGVADGGAWTAQVVFYFWSHRLILLFKIKARK